MRRRAHATRLGTALDGHGICGNHTGTSAQGHIYPADLDACGGRVGVTPDSKGMSVHYYMTQSKAPFTLGCFGDAASYPVTTAQCRALYNECGDDRTTLVTNAGSVLYDLDCPCYDSSGCNVVYLTYLSCNSTSHISFFIHGPYILPYEKTLLNVIYS